MSVIARDGIAADHMVYAWPFPIGPECEISCANDEQVVMCPAWVVGDRLGPGHHRWRTPTPASPVAAYFVLTAPVEVSFDMQTMFMIPSTGQPVRLRGTGSLQVVCNDPALLIAQFVGLPFDAINDGVLRSVSRSIERMLARLLTRRVIMANTPMAVTDPGALQGICEELVSYNPAAGAVFGIDMLRMGHLSIQADDGSRPWHLVVQPSQMPTGTYPPQNNDLPPSSSQPMMHQQQPMQQQAPQQQAPQQVNNGNPVRAVSGEIGGSKPKPSMSKETIRGMAPVPADIANAPSASGPQHGRPPTQPPVSGEIGARRRPSAPPGQYSRAATPVPTEDELAAAPPARASQPMPMHADGDSESRGSIMAVGSTSIGAGSVAGEIPTKVPPGGRVLVPGPNGLMQSATVRQLSGGYYELEVGSSGETIWVPMNGVMPE